MHLQLRGILENDPEITHKLNALWSLHLTGGLSEELSLRLLNHSNEHIRSWVIQLVAENKRVSDAALKEFARLAAADPSPIVRLYLASALQRVPVEKRWNVLSALVAHAEDASDHNLPLMYWYAAEGSVSTDLNRAIELMSKSQIPRIREFIARRLASSRRVASN